MARARRGTAPTRAQQQAARPEYTLNVEKEKQVRSTQEREKLDGGKADRLNINKDVCNAGARGRGDLRVQEVGERRRGGTGTTSSGTER
eukprot:4730084-Pleurochrysis_carterae.AAC.1